MSYKALYRTHRPKKFEEVKGQEHIVTTLKNIITRNKVSHAYLFAGPRGTGKTTVAHIFAKILNCSDLQQSTISCEKCKQCISAIKNSLDIIEIDAASNNGVSEIRTIIDNSSYSPSISKYKIYIIDEIHMLSKGAFNALLKTLEEPPSHVIFILATTEPHKIPITILSRTQRFNFRRISNQILFKRVAEVLDKEKIQYDEESLNLIAKLSNGGMRDALSIADQASAYSNNKISFEAISQVFGIVSIENQIKLINLSGQCQIKELLLLTSEFIENGANIEKLVASLIDILKDSIVFAKTSDINLLEFLSKLDIEKLQITSSFAYKAIDILMKLLSDLRFSEVPRQAFELSLLKIIEINNFNINGKDDVNLKTFKKSIIEKPIVQKIVKDKEQNFNEFSNDKNIEEETINDKSTNLMNLFTTQELNQEKQNEISTQKKMEEIEQKLEKSKEFNFTSSTIEKDLANKSTNAQNSDEINEDIEDVVFSKEISIKNKKEQDSKKSKDVQNEKKEFKHNTQDIDLMKLFQVEKTQDLLNKDEEKEIEFQTSEIINLLVQSQSEAMQNAKNNWHSILSYYSHSEFGEFATFLNDSKIISAGNGFILVSSKEDSIINEINSFRKNSKFIKFTQVIFGKPQWLFGITKDKFELIKKTWVDLKNNDSLPQPKPIKKIQIVEEEAEKFGNSLFGDLFNS